MKTKSSNKRECIELLVQRDFNAIPTEWVQIVAEKKNEYHTFPMWGTMFMVDDFIGEKLMKHTVEMKDYCSDDPEAENVDEEMAGELRIGDTAAYLYEIDGRYLIGVQGAGWNFYDGVWDRIYDLLELKWHEN